MLTNSNSLQTLHHKRRRFLEHYESLCVIGKAAEATGVTRQTIYDWLKASEAFKVAFAGAKQGVVEKLEAEAIRRAYAGIDKAVWYKGVACGVEKEYSDTLLIFLLKGAAPEKYRERHEVTGSGGQPLEIFVRWDGNRNETGSGGTPEAATSETS
uniref:Putative terminase n=1 Tax=viral metagenome TaxID=1070528 RepID=A0A6H2A2Y7_9ZZZZ